MTLKKTYRDHRNSSHDEPRISLATSTPSKNRPLDSVFLKLQFLRLAPPRPTFGVSATSPRRFVSLAFPGRYRIRYLFLTLYAYGETLSKDKRVLGKIHFRRPVFTQAGNVFQRCETHPERVQRACVCVRPFWISLGTLHLRSPGGGVGRPPRS